MQIKRKKLGAASDYRDNRYFWRRMIYTIIDIETTGGNNKSGKITEIAAFKHDGTKVLDKFTTLVNPLVPIPPFITKLTGISNEMVAAAPEFDEIARELDVFTANSIFVAHNVNFDYGFIREEFRKLGMEYRRKTLCTVQLSRSTFPGLASYSLDKITRELDISLNGHHRAEADAQATVFLFEKILSEQSQAGLFDAHYGMPDVDQLNSPLITKEVLESIPDDQGVFRFYDSDDDLIYVKRSAQILSGICAKLKPNETKDSAAIRQNVYRIDWQVTGSALAAQLLEANEVLKFKPHFNHGRFSIKIGAALDLCTIADRSHLVLTKYNAAKNPQMVFGNFYEGLDIIQDMASKFSLELTQVKIRNRSFPAICAMGDDETKLLAALPSTSYYITDEGPRVGLTSVISVQEGKAKQYGCFENDGNSSPFDEDDFEYNFQERPESELIIRQHLAKNKFEKIIPIRS